MVASAAAIGRQRRENTYVMILSAQKWVGRVYHAPV